MEDENYDLEIDEILTKYKVLTLILKKVKAKSFKSGLNNFTVQLEKCSFDEVSVFDFHSITDCQIKKLNCSPNVFVSNSNIEKMTALKGLNDSSKFYSCLNIYQTNISSLVTVGEKINITLDHSKIKNGSFLNAVFEDIRIVESFLNYDCFNLKNEIHVSLKKSTLNGLFFNSLSKIPLRSFELKSCNLNCFGKIPDTFMLSIEGNYKDFTLKGNDSLGILRVFNSNVANDRSYETPIRACFEKSPNFTKDFILNEKSKVEYDEEYPLGHFGQVSETIYTFAEKSAVKNLYIDNSDTLILNNFKGKSLIVKNCRWVEFNNCDIKKIECDEFYPRNSIFKKVVSSKKRIKRICEKCCFKQTTCDKHFKNNCITKDEDLEKPFFDKVSLPVDCPFKLEHLVELT